MATKDPTALNRALTIFEEFSASEEIDIAIKQYPHAHDMIEAAKWRIARQPDCGIEIGNEEPFHRILKLPPLKNSQNPTLIVRFYVNEHEAIIDWAKFYPYEESQAISPAAFIYKRQ
jgi:hypothetical protein